MLLHNPKKFIMTYPWHCTTTKIYYDISMTLYHCKKLPQRIHDTVPTQNLPWHIHDTVPVQKITMTHPWHCTTTKKFTRPYPWHCTIVKIYYDTSMTLYNISGVHAILSCVNNCDLMNVSEDDDHPLNYYHLIVGQWEASYFTSSSLTSFDGRLKVLLQTNRHPLHDVARVALLRDEKWQVEVGIFLQVDLQPLGLKLLVHVAH